MRWFNKTVGVPQETVDKVPGNQRKLVNKLELDVDELYSRLNSLAKSFAAMEAKAANRAAHLDVLIQAKFQSLEKLRVDDARDRDAFLSQVTKMNDQLRKEHNAQIRRIVKETQDRSYDIGKSLTMVMIDSMVALFGVEEELEEDE